MNRDELINLLNKVFTVDSNTNTIKTNNPNYELVIDTISRNTRNEEGVLMGDQWGRPTKTKGTNSFNNIDDLADFILDDSSNLKKLKLNNLITGQKENINGSTLIHNRLNSSGKTALTTIGLSNPIDLNLLSNLEKDSVVINELSLKDNYAPPAPNEFVRKEMTKLPVLENMQVKQELSKKFMTDMNLLDASGNFTPEWEAYKNSYTTKDYINGSPVINRKDFELFEQFIKADDMSDVKVAITARASKFLSQDVWTYPTDGFLRKIIGYTIEDNFPKYLKDNKVLGNNRRIKIANPETVMDGNKQAKIIAERGTAGNDFIVEDYNTKTSKWVENKSITIDAKSYLSDIGGRDTLKSKAITTLQKELEAGKKTIYLFISGQGISFVDSEVYLNLNNKIVDNTNLLKEQFKEKYNTRNWSDIDARIRRAVYEDVNLLLDMKGNNIDSNWKKIVDKAMTYSNESIAKYNTTARGHDVVKSDASCLLMGDIAKTGNIKDANIVKKILGS